MTHAIDSIASFQLDNGLSVVVIPTQSPVLALQLWVKTGSIHEESYLGAGLSHFVEHMVFKGTEDYTYQELFKTVQNAGAKLNAYTTFDHTVYTFDGTASAFTTGLAILNNLGFKPTFPEQEWGKERDVILREIALYADDPDDRLDTLVLSTAYRVHPYRYPVIGYQKLFEQLTLDHLKQYWQKRYGVNNAILVVASNLPDDQIRTQVTSVFGAHSQRYMAPLWIPDEPLQLVERSQRLTGHYQLTRGILAFKIPGLGHPDLVPLQVIGTVLGSGESSILYQKLRKELRCVYQVDTSVCAELYQGLLIIKYTCDADKRTLVEQQLQEHLVQWTLDALDQKAIDKTYRQALITEIDTNRSASELAQHIGWVKLNFDDFSYPQHYLDQLKTLTVEAVQTVIHRYLIPSQRVQVSLEPTPQSTPSATVNPTSVPQQKLATFELQSVRLVYQRCTHLPKTHIVALFPAGALRETPQERGISHLFATLLTKDTRQQSALDIANQIEAIGGQWQGFVGNDYLGLSIETLAENTTLAIQLLQEALTQYNLVPQTFKVEKQAQIAALNDLQDDITYVGLQGLRQQFFQNHPYAVPPNGTQKTLAGITLEDCQRFGDRLIQANNCVLSIVSSLPKQFFVDALGPLCNTLPTASSSNHILDDQPFTPQPTERVPVHFQQAMVLLGYPIAGYTHPDFLIGALLETLLNEISSVLEEPIREIHGLAYTVGATRILGSQLGLLGVLANTKTEQVDKVHQEMIQCMNTLLTHRLTSEIFTACRNCLKTNRQICLQSIGYRAFTAGYHCLLKLPMKDYLSYDALVDSITLDDFIDRCHDFIENPIVRILTHHDK
ncbi:MAG: insulinase family protein [Opitutales bacterium]|nr:insulinase family protein [Opitutales bacterium]